MEIRFSEYMQSRWERIHDTAKAQNVKARFTNARGHYCCTFTLEGDEAAHDRVIHALLKLDPQATIRTARAVYEGLADYESQLKVRKESK